MAEGDWNRKLETPFASNEDRGGKGILTLDLSFFSRDCISIDSSKEGMFMIKPFKSCKCVFSESVLGATDFKSSSICNLKRFDLKSNAVSFISAISDEEGSE